MNNKILSIVVAVLSALVLTLSYKVFFNTNSSKKEIKKTPIADTKGKPVKIAYINIDSLMTNYTFAKEYNQKINAEKNAIESKYENLAAGFDKEVRDYQQKLQMGQLNAEEIQKTEQRLGAKQQKIAQDREIELEKLLQKSEQNNKKFNEELDNFIKDYNSDGEYTYILSYIKNREILYADSTFDITKDIVDGLNKQYEEKNKK